MRRRLGLGLKAIWKNVACIYDADIQLCLGCLSTWRVRGSMQEWKIFLVPLATLLSLDLADCIGGHSIHD